MESGKKMKYRRCRLMLQDRPWGLLKNFSDWKILRSRTWIKILCILNKQHVCEGFHYGIKITLPPHHIPPHLHSLPHIRTSLLVWYASFLQLFFVSFPINPWKKHWTFSCLVFIVVRRDNPQWDKFRQSKKIASHLWIIWSRKCGQPDRNSTIEIAVAVRLAI